MNKKQEKQNFSPLFWFPTPGSTGERGQKMFAKFTSRRGLINPRQQICCQNEHWSRGREKQNKSIRKTSAVAKWKRKKKCHKGFPPARSV